MEHLYLGIDIGTQSVKAAAFNASGEIRASAVEKQYMDTPHPGWATEKADIWWEKAVQCIQKILKNISAEAIKGIGVDGVCHSPVLVDQDGELLQRDIQLYCDKRNADIVERCRTDYKACGIWEETGNVPACNWMGMKIRWIKENEPELYEKAACILSAKDYINLRLTGITGTDPSEASGTMRLNRKDSSWSKLAVSYMGLDMEKLPAIRRSCEIMGTVTREAAALTGLKKGTPVVAGSGDMPSSLYGAGLIKPGICVDIAGTGSVIAVYSPCAVLNEKIANLRCASPGWSPYLSMDSSGGAYRWMRDVMCKYEMKKAEQEGISSFDYLNRLAGAVPPGAEGVLFLPYLQGERIRGSAYSKATFTGLTPASTTGHLARAVMEGVAFECRASLELLDPLDEAEFVILTGGAAAGTLWSQIKADIYGKPVKILKQKETAAFGGALLAAVANGEYKDEEAASNAVLKFEDEFLPIPENQSMYAELYPIFEEIHQRLQVPHEHLAGLRR